MIRFAWRQFRTQAFVAFGALAVVGIALAITGPHLFDLYETGIKTCAARGDCSNFNGAFTHNDRALQTWANILVLVVPGIIGIFWGAPLVARELETGTHRLVWTQSVTRTRWLASKMIVIGVASAVFAGLLSLMVTWWSSRLDAAAMNVYGTFDQRDLVPIGYAVFAFALGATAGVVIRKMLPAMASTLIAFVGFRVAFDRLLRPRLLDANALNLPLTQRTAGFGSANGGPFTLIPNAPTPHNSWTTSLQIVNHEHQTLSAQVVARVCPRLVSQSGGSGQSTGLGALKPTAPTNKLLNECFSRIGATYREFVAYQTPGHYWTMQWYELALYLGSSLGLALLCVWWVRRRLS